MPHAGLALSARESLPQAITAVDLPMKKAANCMSLAAFVMRFGGMPVVLVRIKPKLRGKAVFFRTSTLSRQSAGFDQIDDPSWHRVGV